MQNGPFHYVLNYLLYYIIYVIYYWITSTDALTCNFDVNDVAA